MKILAVGDFHGKFPEKLKKIAGKVDLILSDGDYTGIDEFRPALKKMFQLLAKGKKTSVKEILGKKKYIKLEKKDYAIGKIVLKEINKIGIKTISVFQKPERGVRFCSFHKRLLRKGRLPKLLQVLTG